MITLMPEAASVDKYMASTGDPFLRCLNFAFSCETGLTSSILLAQPEIHAIDRWRRPAESSQGCNNLPPVKVGVIQHVSEYFPAGEQRYSPIR